MPAHRVQWTVYATEAKAREVHAFMLGRAAQARVLNEGLPTAEPGGGELHELVAGTFALRERFTVTGAGAEQDAPISGSGGPIWRSIGFSVYDDAEWAADALAQTQALAQQAALLITQPDPQPVPPVTANAGSIHVCNHEAGEPCVVADSWTVAIPTAPSAEAWAAGTNYLAGGEERAHAGQAWRNRRANNTQQLAPGTNGSGWLRISNLPAPWYNLGNEGYPVSWEVTHNGKLWRAGSDNLFWEPGVFGWTDLGPAP
jgi:hypothetical protein